MAADEYDKVSSMLISGTSHATAAWDVISARTKELKSEFTNNERRES